MFGNDFSLLEVMASLSKANNEMQQVQSNFETALKTANQDLIEMEAMRDTQRINKLKEKRLN